ncbi:MAG: sulfurtransferase TusA family protein [Actinomycetota bacterium]
MTIEEPTYEDLLQNVGETFVNALADRDFERLRAAIADDVRFRLLLPKGPQAHSGVVEAVESFVRWYGDVDELHLESSSVEAVAGRLVLMYRFRLHDEDGWQVIEQHVVADVAPDGRLEKIDLLCSGFLPIIGPEDGSSSIHPFDAGDLGCADGLAGEFRRRIGAIPVGDVLVVTARDPAAKEDLPPLARMMGQEVRSVETPDDGRLLMTVERRR